MKKILMFLLSIVGVGAVVNEQKIAKQESKTIISMNGIVEEKETAMLVYRPSGMAELTGLQKYRIQIHGDPSQPVREAGSFDRARLN